MTQLKIQALDYKMTKTKYLIITTLALVSLSLPASIIFAQDQGATDSGTTSMHESANTNSFFNVADIMKLIKEASNSATRNQDRAASIIKGADMMITNRTRTLNNLNSRIESDERLTQDQKSSLSQDIQTAISGLNTLKVTIDADTDPAQARADTKKIVTDFRVYEILEPKLRLLVTLNNLQATVSNLQTLIPQIQSIISTLNSQGKDTSALTTLLTDISNQLVTINTTITNDIAILNSVSVTSANFKDTFSQVRTDITNIIKTNFGRIRSDFGQMRTSFKDLITGSSSAQPSPVSTSSAAPVATP